MTEYNPSVQQKLKELKDQAQKATEEITKLEGLLKIFPDLEVTKDRWGTVRYYANSANDLVNDYYTKHSCGCCSDSPLFVYPYLYVEGVKVHSKPDHFCIGEKNAWGTGEIYDPDSVKALVEKNISDIVVKQIEILVKTPVEEVDEIE